MMNIFIVSLDKACSLCYHRTPHPPYPTPNANAPSTLPSLTMSPMDTSFDTTNTNTPTNTNNYDPLNTQ